MLTWNKTGSKTSFISITPTIHVNRKESVFHFSLFRNKEIYKNWEQIVCTFILFWTRATIDYTEAHPLFYKAKCAFSGKTGSVVKIQLHCRGSAYDKPVFSKYERASLFTASRTGNGNVAAFQTFYKLVTGILFYVTNKMLYVHFCSPVLHLCVYLH